MKKIMFALLFSLIIGNVYAEQIANIAEANRTIPTAIKILQEKAKELNLDLKFCKFEIYFDNSNLIIGFTKELPQGLRGDSLVIGLKYADFINRGELTFIGPR